MIVRRSTFVLIGVLVSLLIAGVVLAVPGFDDRGNPNDPRVNERANACYDGGTLAGKCDEQAEWDAGWYLIRFEYGLLNCDNFPSQFRWVLPTCGETGGGSIGDVLPTFTPTMPR